MTDLLETTENGIAWLTLNRPDRLNAFSPAMLTALGEALQRLSGDAAVGGVVITGAGRGFCAGGDVRTMPRRAAQGFEERVEGLRRMHQLPMLLRTMPKVAIAMVNGPAVGAGLGLAMACDLRVAARSARFGTGFAKARELYFLGEIIDAEAARSLGLVSRVVEDDALRDETAALARRIADGPRIAYGYMKRNLFAAETEPLAAVLEMEAVHQARTAMTEDHLEASRAFAEKRRPVFKGR